MHNFFDGWYMKCQSETQTLAVIPAIHRNDKNYSCSIQVITEDKAWNIVFPIWMFQKFRDRGKGEIFMIGDNVFHRKGMRLFLHTQNLQLEGYIKYGKLTSLNYDIMGPFAFVPFMECRHKVFSMCHRINGKLFINGNRYYFHNGKGYWEGDRGYSFPKEYLWTQCHLKGGSLMLSVAEIPLGKINFTGIIGIVYWKGKEYRFATYLGAKIVTLKNGCVRVTQGKKELEARLLEKSPKALKAPEQGNMTRTIHESAASLAYYRFEIQGGTVFECKTEKASFEYEYFR